jgi:hypothetical protein
MLQSLAEDSGVRNLKITRKKKDLFEARRAEIKDLAESKPDLLADAAADNVRSHIERTDLQVVKVVFDRTRKWDFVFRGFKIAAAITDSDFLDTVKAGEKFGDGDTIDADLKITELLDPGTNTWFNSSFEVVKVHSHRTRPAQKTFEFPDRENPS